MSAPNQNDRKHVEFTEHYEWGVLHPDSGRVVMAATGRLMDEDQAREWADDKWHLVRRQVGPFVRVEDA